jgi:hypothetical protein
MQVARGSEPMQVLSEGRPLDWGKDWLWYHLGPS